MTINFLQTPEYRTLIQTHIFESIKYALILMRTQNLEKTKEIKNSKIKKPSFS